MPQNPILIMKAPIYYMVSGHILNSVKDCTRQASFPGYDNRFLLAYTSLRLSLALSLSLSRSISFLSLYTVAYTHGHRAQFHKHTYLHTSTFTITAEL